MSRIRTGGEIALVVSAGIIAVLAGLVPFCVSVYWWVTTLNTVAWHIVPFAMVGAGILTFITAMGLDIIVKTILTNRKRH